MNLPDELINHLRDGTIILFLGAGASFGASDNIGQKAPMGNELGQYLNKELLDNEFKDTDPLAVIAQTAIGAKGRKAVQDAVARRISALRPADYHHRIARLRWRLIATTNYDSLIEQVYESAKGTRVQDLHPWVRNAEEIDPAIRRGNLVYLKLHGCIRHIEQDDLDLIMSPEQFNAHREGRGNLFDHFRNQAFDNPVVYVGFQLADQNIIGYDDQIAHNLGARRYRSYAISPNVGENRRAFLSSKGIEFL